MELLTKTNNQGLPLFCFELLKKKKQRDNQGLPSVSENCPKHKRVANKGCCEDLDQDLESNFGGKFYQLLIQDLMEEETATKRKLR